MDKSTTAGNDKQRKRVANDEGSNKEGGKGNGNGDEGGRRAMATMVKKRARAAMARMVTRVVGDDEGDGDGGNMVTNNDDGLVPVVVQQPILYLSSASLDNFGDDKLTGRRLPYALRTNNVGDGRTTTRMTTTSSCCDAVSSSCLSLVL